MSHRHDEQPRIGARTALVVLLATTSPAACSDVTEGGGTAGSGGTGTGTQTGTGTGTGTTTDTPSTSADSCPILTCDAVAVGEMLVAAAQSDGSTLTIELTKEPNATCSSSDYAGWSADPAVEVAPELGTLESVAVDGTTITITITLAENPTDGTVNLVGEVTGYGSLTCPVERQFQVTWPDAGGPEIAAADTATQPALQHGRDVRLALAQTTGTHATIELSGAPPGAEVQFAVSEGQVRQSGARAVWTLPERPGLYQIEAVVRQGVVVASEVLRLEVRPAVEVKRG